MYKIESDVPTAIKRLSTGALSEKAPSGKSIQKLHPMPFYLSRKKVKYKRRTEEQTKEMTEI